MYLSKALTFCIFILLFATNSLFGQTRIDSRIDLADTTQIHELTTQRGDRFIGQVMELSEIAENFSE